MKISELYITKTVDRRVRNYDGSFYIEKQTFKVPYNPNVEVIYRRLFAKFIDMIVVFSLIFILKDLINVGRLFLLVFF
ncbi:hypothetical protein Y10_07840 [Neptunitalea sp. Y10]|uniref:RDD domain-containing protein n=1 Tax=Neptunitalea lumnitzerae TaxID=2965509 RepID=A0ABQ5MGI9_9FLAO|nr:hypothetical protein Y10_07840 [Neptunitalea sp. Y10]